MSEPYVITGLEQLKERAGTELGVSRWVEVEQERITAFAKLSGDEQFIHVDPERAAAEGPFGSTVQHGFLTLSMSTGLLWEIVLVEGFSVILNYGLNKVRFPAPLKTGSNFRLRVTLDEVNEIKGGVETVYGLTFEVDGQDKPAAVASLVFRYYD